MAGQPGGSGSGAAGSVIAMLLSRALILSPSRPARKLPKAAPEERMPCTITTGEEASYLAPIQSTATAHTSQPTAPLESTTSLLAVSISKRKRFMADWPGALGNLSLATGTLNDCDTQTLSLPLRVPSSSSL